MSVLSELLCINWSTIEKLNQPTISREKEVEKEEMLAEMEEARQIKMKRDTFGTSHNSIDC